MGLFDFFWRLFSPRPSRPEPRAPRARKRRRKPWLVPLRRQVGRLYGIVKDMERNAE